MKRFLSMKSLLWRMGESGGPGRRYHVLRPGLAGSLCPQQAPGFDLCTQLDLALGFGLSIRLDSDTGARKADGGSPTLAALRFAHSYTAATASSGHQEDGPGLGCVLEAAMALSPQSSLLLAHQVSSFPPRPAPTLASQVWT